MLQRPASIFRRTRVQPPRSAKFSGPCLVPLVSALPARWDASLGSKLIDDGREIAAELLNQLLTGQRARIPSVLGSDGISYLLGAGPRVLGPPHHGEDTQPSTKEERIRHDWLFACIAEEAAERRVRERAGKPSSDNFDKATTKAPPGGGTRKRIGKRKANGRPPLGDDSRWVRNPLHQAADLLPTVRWVLKRYGFPKKLAVIVAAQIVGADEKKFEILPDGQRMLGSGSQIKSLTSFGLSGRGAVPSRAQTVGVKSD